MRPLDLGGDDGRLGRGAGDGAARGELPEEEEPLPKRLGSVDGEEYLESRKLPGREAYCESLKPPRRAKVLPEYRSWVEAPCDPYLGAPLSFP